MQITQIDGISGSNVTSTAWAGTPDAYDLAAEREAQAVEFMQENAPRRIGRPTGSPITCTDAAAAPVDAEGKLIRKHRNSHKKAVDRWRTLVYLLQVANDLSASPDARAQAHARVAKLTRWHMDTQADRVRQAQRRHRRAKLLAELQRVRSQWIPFGVALKLADMGERTLYRATMEGRVRKSTAGNRIVVSVPDLKSYLRVKIAA